MVDLIEYKTEVYNALAVVSDVPEQISAENILTMDQSLKDELLKQYGSIAAFAQNASDGDFIWGISDLFGYQGPADFVRIFTDEACCLVLHVLLWVRRRI